MALANRSDALGFDEAASRLDAPIPGRGASPQAGAPPPPGEGFPQVDLAKATPTDGASQITESSTFSQRSTPEHCECPAHW